MNDDHIIRNNVLYIFTFTDLYLCELASVHWVVKLCFGAAYKKGVAHQKQYIKYCTFFIIKWKQKMT